MLKYNPLTSIRVYARQLYHKLRGPLWFPHVPVTLLVIFSAAWVIYTTLGQQMPALIAQFSAGEFNIVPKHLPLAVIGGGLLIMAFGLSVRSRFAWTMALILIIAAIVNLYVSGSQGTLALFVFLILITGLLALTWKSFNHATLTGSTLFAVASIFMLFSYASFGALHLGDQFKPPINDLVTALYFSTVTMSTVGYGDITPQTIDTKLFTISLIVLGVAVFATSLTAVVTPLVSRSMKHITNRQAHRMKRENHFVVLGNSILAQNTFRELKSRGQPVTRVLRQKPEQGAELDTDIVIGDTGNSQTLKDAGCDKAIAVLAMFDDDSENAFAILAVRELGGSGKTISAVNNPENLSRIRLVKPDVVIAPQILGGELAAMLACGEEITAEHVISSVFNNLEKPA